MRWFGLAVVFLIVLIGGLYAALPWLLSSVFAAQLTTVSGLDELSLEIDHPGLDSLRIESLAASTGSLTVSGRNVRLDYSLDSLLQRRLLTIQAEALAVSLEPAAAAVAERGDRPAAARVPSVADILPLVPADVVIIDALSLAVPAGGFLAEGRLALREETLTATLTGRQPAAAENLQIEITADASGSLQARLSDGHPETPSMLSMDAITRPETMQISLGANLTGYPLELIQQVLGVAPGSGRLIGELNTTLPWPPLDVPDWRTLNGNGSFELDWSRPAAAAGAPAARVSDASGRIELEQGRAALTLAGELTLTMDGISLLTTLEDGRFDFAEGVLRSDSPQAEISFSADDVTAKLVPGRLEVNLTGAPTLALESSVSAERNGQKMSGAVTASTRLQAHGTSGDFRFDGEVATFPLELTGDYTYAADTLEAKGRLRSGPVLDLPLLVTYQPGTGAGRVDVRQKLEFHKPLFAAILPGFTEAYDLDQGAIGIDGTASWSPKGFTAEIALEPAVTRAHYDDYLATNLSGRVRLSATERGWQFDAPELKAGALDVGFPVTNLKMTGSGDADRIRVESLSAELLGGSARAAPFDYHVTPGSAEIMVALSDLDLAAVLALEGDDITGTGRLDGRVPLILSNNTTSVAGGEIAATSPGNIRLAAALASSITQPGLDIALKALENFAYETLAATVNYDADGNMDLGIRLEGRNRSVEAGRPIHYNLNISENIPVLLKSLRLQDAVTKSIEKKIRQ